MSRGPNERLMPGYDLAVVQTAFRAGRFRTTTRVQRYLSMTGWNRAAVCECVRSLQSDDFYKSQAHRDRPGVWLDIYRPVWDSERVYVKFTEWEQPGTFLVLTFCRDGDAH